MTTEQTQQTSTIVKWAVIAAIAIFLIWILFRGCGAGNVHKEDKKQVDSIINITNQRHRTDSIFIAAYKTAVDTLSFQTQIQKQKIAALEQQLDISGTRANKLAYAVANAKIVHDTTEYVANCDSLTEEVGLLTAMVDDYQEQNRHLKDGYEFKSAYQDSIINVQERQITTLMQSLSQVSALYDALYKTYAKLVKGNKFERAISRILAAAVLVLSGKVFLFK